MITAVDTNILLDIFLPDPHFSKSSLESLKLSEQEGSIIICEWVYAELAVAFHKKEMLSSVLKEANIQLKFSNEDILWTAAQIWKTYIHSTKRKGGKTRILPDFLIGSHANFYADKFLTRDRGFYRSCFKNLKTEDPTPQ